MKNSPLITFCIVILTLATIGIISAVVIEAYAHEPVYVLIMKVCGGLLGVGGPLLGWGMVRKNKPRK